MSATYEPIATTTASGSANSITFSSISSAYTDLILVANGQVATAANMYLQFGNGSIDTGSNYSDTRLIAENTGTVASNRASNGTYIRLDGYAFWRTSYSATNIIQIQNYSNTSTNKTALVRSGNASGGVDAIVGLWRSTSAINTIKFGTIGGANISSGSTFTLYGIKAE
jgi:threonine dehydratase